MMDGRTSREGDVVVTEGSGAPDVGAVRPEVGVVIATRDRPQLVREAIASVRDQDYPGVLRTLVVFDGEEPDPRLRSDDPRRPVEVTRNARSTGLSGSRNTGVLALGTELVAFLDDDDVWLPSKIDQQVRRWEAEPEAVLVSTAIEVLFQGSSSTRTAGRDRVRHDELLRSRMAMLHSSTFLFHRSALVEVGLVSEEVPGSMCEDWDVLLRAAARHDVLHVDEPLVRVLWGSTSFFSTRWETKIAAHQWMLAHHPAILQDRVGGARVLGQMAFSHAALGRRRDALRWAARATRRNPREPRAPIAVAVALGLVSSQRVLATLHRRGHGI